MPKPYVPNDEWSKRAAAEGYRARSVYKLKELDERFDLLKPGMTILDLGAAPGSWLQYVSKKIGPQGKAIGMDLTEIAPIAANVSLYVQDIADVDAVSRILEKEGIDRVDLVLSDIAPSTSGVKDIDQWRSIELVTAVLSIAETFLKPGGRCVVKVFRGADFDAWIKNAKALWKDVQAVSVDASRDRSKEIYVLLKKPTP